MDIQLASVDNTLSPVPQKFTRPVLTVRNITIKINSPALEMKAHRRRDNLKLIAEATEIHLVPISCDFKENKFFICE